MTLKTYPAPTGAAEAVETYLRDMGHLRPEPRGGRGTGHVAAPGHTSTRMQLAYDRQASFGGAGLITPWANAQVAEPVRDPINESAFPAQPLMVRMVPGTALHSRHWFLHVKVAGWRYLIPEGPTSVDFMADDHSPDRVMRGPIVTQLVKAANLAASRFGDLANVVTVGILDVPTLQIEALTLEDGRRFRCIVYRSKLPVEPLDVEDGDAFAHRLETAFNDRAPGTTGGSHLAKETDFALPAMAANVG